MIATLLVFTKNFISPLLPPPVDSSDVFPVWCASDYGIWPKGSILTAWSCCDVLQWGRGYDPSGLLFLIRLVVGSY
jgi:hypothetical protein